MAQLLPPDNAAWPFPFPRQDWEQTPPAVQAYLRTVCNALRQLQERVDTLEARLQQTSTTSHRPPSSDSPYKKPRQRPTATTPRKAGGKPGHVAIARRFCLPRQSRSCGPSGVRVATRRLP